MVIRQPREQRAAQQRLAGTGFAGDENQSLTLPDASRDLLECPKVWVAPMDEMGIGTQAERLQPRHRSPDNRGERRLRALAAVEQRQHDWGSVRSTSRLSGGGDGARVSMSPT